MSVKKFEVVRGEQDGLVSLDLVTNQRRWLIEQGRMQDRQIGNRQEQTILRIRKKNVWNDGNPKLYQLDVETGEIHYLLDTETTSLQRGSRDRTSFTAPAVRSCFPTKAMLAGAIRTALCGWVLRIDEYGSEAVLSWPGAIQAIETVNGQLWLIGLQDQKLQELYSWDPETKTTRQLTHFHDELLAPARNCQPEHFMVSRGGLAKLNGWIRNRRTLMKSTYPGDLDIHGGPKTAYGEVFFHEMQFWAAQGYIVFFCNPTGSDGRATRFTTICAGAMGRSV